MREHSGAGRSPRSHAGTARAAVLARGPPLRLPPCEAARAASVRRRAARGDAGRASLLRLRPASASAMRICDRRGWGSTLRGSWCHMGGDSTYEGFCPGKAAGAAVRVGDGERQERRGSLDDMEAGLNRRAESLQLFADREPQLLSRSNSGWTAFSGHISSAPSSESRFSSYRNEE